MQIYEGNSTIFFIFVITLHKNSSDSLSLLPLESSFDEPRAYQCLCQIASVESHFPFAQSQCSTQQ